MSKPFLLVGIDGSPASGPALRYALNEAKTRGYVVHAMTCWSAELTAKHGTGIPSAASYEDAVRVLNTVIRHVATSAAEVRLTVALVDEGQPGPLLVSASRKAAALILGAPHRGFFAQLAGHKAGDYCIRHANVPVVLVPWETDDLDENDIYRDLQIGSPTP